MEFRETRARIVNKIHVALASYESVAAQDIDLERQRQALAATARFVDQHLSLVPGVRAATVEQAKQKVLEAALDAVQVDGLVVEFGVASGASLRDIAERLSPAYGFDSFEGLPDSWRTNFAPGAFAQALPHVTGAELVVGWFSDTLPSFLLEHPEPFRFVHMDADLYSSTRDVFEFAFDRFRPGTIMLFDEYFNYPGWEQHEHRAFIEFLERYEGGHEWLCYNAMHEQVAVRLT